MEKIITKRFVLVDKRKIAEEEGLIEMGDLDKVVIKILATGICGSDLHYFNFRKEKDKINQIRKKPLILGHEAVGRVIHAFEAVYPDGRKVLVNDLVAIDPLRSCSDLNIPKCLVCQNKKLEENYCLNSQFLGSTVDGTLQTYLSYSSKKLIKLSEDFSPIEGVLIEPLAIANKIAKKETCSELAIIGDGSLGLLIGKMFSYYGLEKLTLFGVNNTKLAYAGSFAKTINILQDSYRYENPADLIIECVGGEYIPKTLTQALNLTKPGGKILLVGLSHLKPKIDLQGIIKKNLSLEGIFRCSYQDMLEAYGLLENEVLRKELIEVIDDKLFPLTTKGVQEAFNYASDYSLAHKSKVVVVDT